MVERNIEALDLVRHVGVSLSTAKKLMTGIRAPGLRTARVINDFFGRRIYTLHSGHAKTKRRCKTL